jgi:uncharacterized membrane protein HdeD (DUF308 family)
MEISQKRNGWLALLLFGILLILTGIVAIFAPYVATVATLMVIGVLLLIGGVIQIVYSIVNFKSGDYLVHLLLGIFSVLIGVLILSRPELAAASITMLIATFFLTLGLFRIITSLVGRYDNWGWILLGGIIDLILGFLILAQWPSSALWVIGLFVGIDFIFMGWTFIALGVLGKKVRSDLAA